MHNLTPRSGAAPSDVEDAVPSVGQQLCCLLLDSTRPTRFLLALVAFGWGYLFMPPGNVLLSQPYQMMALVMPWQGWSAAFLVYGLLAGWTLFRRGGGLSLCWIVNTYGLAVFSVACVSFAAEGLRPTPATLASNVGMVIAAFWIFVRTPSSTSWNTE